MSIVAQTAPVVTTSIPYTFGNADARHGACCLPELYFTHPLDKRDYALGFEAITGPTFFTVQFTGSQIVVGSMVTA